MVKLNRNLWPAKIFLSVQVLCLFAFLFEQKIIYLLNPDSVAPLIQYSNLLSGTTWSCLMILVTFLFLCQIKTLSPNKYRIVIPAKLLVLSLLIESISIIKLFCSSESLQLLREGVMSGSTGVGIAKVNTLLLYFLALLFFGKIGNKSYQANKRDAFFVGYFFILFFLKGFILSSRGSFINIIAFALAGYTFFRHDSRLKKKHVGMAFLVIISGLFALTTMRVGSLPNGDELFSALITKFSGNFAVSVKYLDDELEVTDKYNLEKNIWFDKKFDFSSSFGQGTGQNVSNFQETFYHYIGAVLRMTPDQEGPDYFKIYNILPFNSSNFLFRFLVFKIYFPLVFCFIFIFYRFFAKLSPAACFFVYCLMLYFALLSFTANAFFEIPFCILPFLGLIFSKCFIVSK